MTGVTQRDPGPLPDDSTVAERRMHALTMRNAGATYAKIAEQFDVSPATAREYVRKAMNENVKLPRDQMVDRQRSILLDLTRVHYPVAMDRTNPNHLSSGEFLVKLLKHEADLFGLYAPARVNVGISDSEFGAQMVELLKVVGPEPLQAFAGRPELPAGPDPVIEAAVIDAEPAPSGEDEAGWSNL